VSIEKASFKPNIVLTIIITKIKSTGQARNLGEAKPVSIYVDTFGTGKVDEGILEQFLIEQDFIQLTPEVLLRIWSTTS